MRIGDGSSDVCSSDLYRDVALGMTGRTVTIRTLDIGADKAVRTGLALSDAPNPALGLRGVPLSLARAGIFETQIRPIVNSAARRVGTECVSTCCSRWSPYHSQKTSSH